MSRRGWWRLTKRWSAPNATRSDGTFRNFCESGAIWRCERERRTPPTKRRSGCGNRSTWLDEQKTRSWELRTTSSLCRLWGEQGRTSEAHAQLAPLLDQIRRRIRNRGSARGQKASQRLRMIYCAPLWAFFKSADCGGAARPIAQAPPLPARGREREPRPCWLPDERRTCISAISGRDAFDCCETINILNKYVWYTEEISPPEPCD